MTVGVEIINDSGTILLDSNIANPVVRQSGNVTTVTNTLTSQPGLSQFTITYSGSASSIPLCGIVPDETTAFLVQQSKSGTTWTFVFLGDFPVGTSVPYFIFDLPPSPSGNFGLEVYDDAGHLTFSIQNKPLRIRDIISSTGTKTYTSGRTYAVITGKFAYLQYWQAGGFDALLNFRIDYFTLVGTAGAIKRTSDDVSHKLELTSIQHSYDNFDHPTADPAEEWDSSPNHFIIADVTNF